MRPLPHLAPAALTLALALTPIASAMAQTLALELIDVQSTGLRVNPRGEALGIKTVWPCGNPLRCAPERLTSVWSGAQRYTLPTLGGQNISAQAIARDGSVVGSLTDFASSGRAVAWRRVGGAYQIAELGNLGLQQSYATGVDASGRVVGYAITPFIATKPFVWTVAGGMTDLTLGGFPADRIQQVSPGGRVVSDGYTYSLDDVTSVRALPVQPAGFRSPQGMSSLVNDPGDLAISLQTTGGGSNPLVQLFRHSVDTGTWQALSTPTPIQLASVAHVIENDGTVIGSGFGGATIAEGPDGLYGPLQPRLSPAYANAGVTLGSARGRTARGDFLINGVLGNSNPLFRTVAITPCVGACLRVSQLAITGTFVDDPKAPGSCTDAARNRVRTVATVTDALGVPQAGVRVRARYMSSYDLNQRVSGLTAANGTVTLAHDGPACRGTIALFVEGLSANGWRFDRGQGVLAAQVVPAP